MQSTDMKHTDMLQTDWIDRAAYPFRSHFLDLPMGRMHYLDEGQGHPLVMLHGTPTWSFLYRQQIRALAQNYRCIVPDHIGFGLSDKPPDWSYKPAEQARNLHALIEHLGLRDITLLVHDFGGPIGLSYALDQPDNVRALVIMNTWLWSLRGIPTMRWSVKALQSALGRWLCTRHNIETRQIIKLAWGKHTKLTREIHQQYIRAVPRPEDRMGMWRFAGELIDSSDWYEHLWQQRAHLADKPALLVWGMKDPLFKPRPFLEHWQAALPAAEVLRLPEVGHFVPDEGGAALTSAVQAFLQRVYS